MGLLLRVVLLVSLPPVANLLMVLLALLRVLLVLWELPLTWEWQEGSGWFL